MNEEKFTNVTHRLKSFLEAKKLSVMAFENAIGTGKGVFAKALKNETGFNVKLLLEVGEKFPNLNMDWLIHGRGEMIIGPIELTNGLVITNSQDNWKDKYYRLMEKYNQCLEEKASEMAKGLVLAGK